MKTDVIMGIPVDSLTKEDVLKDVTFSLNNGKKMSIISVNPQIVSESNKYPEIVEFIKQGTHRIPDGIGIVLVSRIKKGNIRARLAGFDIMMELLQYANEKKKSIFLYGAHSEVLKDALRNIRVSYPDLQILGSIDGYTNLTEREVVEEINKKNPDFLFVALGFPRQELFLARNINILNATVFQDIGGSLDVISGHAKRAPNFFIKWHLEWLYRSLSSPKRIGRILQLPVFLIKSLGWNSKK
jgi:N-acetylglucosaminyldiphosphoundecaprenol N-acetyl-beta-D-mannosaminyltransferase